MKTHTIEELGSRVDLNYWRETYKEAKLLRRHYWLPIRWGMLLSVISTLIAVLAEGVHDDDDDLDT